MYVILANVYLFKDLKFISLICLINRFKIKYY